MRIVAYPSHWTTGLSSAGIVTSMPAAVLVTLLARASHLLHFLQLVHMLLQDHVTDILTGNPTLEDLGVNLLRLEDRAPFELKPFRMNAYYDEALGEFADPVPPPIVS